MDLGHIQFRIKEDARKHFSAMLTKYSIGQAITAEDERDLDALFRRHNDYDQKVGSGIDHFVVMDDGHNYKCFGVRRKDGTLEDFTYKGCIYGT